MKHPENHPMEPQQSSTRTRKSSNKTVLKLGTYSVRFSQVYRRYHLSRWMPMVISACIVSSFTLLGLWLTRGQANPRQQASNIAEAGISGTSTSPTVDIPTAQTRNDTPLPGDAFVIQDPDLLVQGGGDLPFTQAPPGQPANLDRIGNLQAIVSGIITEVLPRYDLKEGYHNRIGILLIDNRPGVNHGQAGAYRATEMFFPASVVKMFWMVRFYNALLSDPKNPQLVAIERERIVDQMIRKSDNNMASRVVDVLTNTSSQDNSNGAALEQWIDRRDQLSKFFRRSGHYSKGLRIGQKTFPITKPTYIAMPNFNELKMRGNPNSPIRNAISVQDAAQLLNEIVNEHAIQNPTYADRAQRILRLNDSDRKNLLGDKDTSYFNPVRTFFSEGLSDLQGIDYYGKAGWTSSSRNEVAYFVDRNKNVVYILAVFTDGKDYAESWKLFPAISRYVYDQMGS